MLDLSLICLVLFMPGSILLFCFRKRLNLDLLECIIFGSITWNYVFLTASIIVGLFSNLLKITFLLFSFTSILFTVIIVMSKLGRIRITLLKGKWAYLKIRIRLHEIFWLASLIFIFSLNFLLLYYHSMIYEWDAVYYYIPSAKSIETTGTLMNVYRQLKFLDTSPATPLLYAYTLHYFELDSIYTIPVIFYFLTIISVYILAREMFDKDLAIFAPLIFLSIPSIQIVLGARALYQDLQFYFYLISTTILLIKLSKGSSSCSRETLLIITSMSSCLTFITRIEFGLFIIFSIIAALIVILRVKNWKIFAGLMLGTPYFLREARNILISGSYNLYLLRLIPVIIAIFLLFILLRNKMTTIDAKNSFSCLRPAIIFLSLLVPPILFFLVNNMVRGGFIIQGIPVSNDMSKATSIFSQLNPVVKAFSYTDLFNWQNMFTVWWTITPFIAPSIIGAYFASYHLIKNERLPPKDLVLFSIFLGVFVLWTQLGCDPQPRRLYLFSVFFTLLMLYGFGRLQKMYPKGAFTLRVVLYLLLSLLLVWSKYPLKSVNDAHLIYPRTYSVAYDLELVLYSTLAFLIIFLLHERYAKMRRRKSAISRVLYVFLIASLVLLQANLFVPIMNEISNNGSSLRYRYLFSTYYYPEVVNYYNKKINDTYSTLGFYCHELITFANRSVIDLSDPTYGWAIYSVIENADETEILNLFQKFNIRYLLLPNDNNRFYTLYRSISSNTALKTVLDDPLKLEPMAKFTYVILYRLHENYLVYSVNYSKIIPWNYNPAVEYILTEKLNTAKFSALTTSDGRISLMYIFDPPLKLHDGLLVRMKSYKKVGAQVILFSNLANRTTDYLFFSTNLEEGEGNFLVAPVNSQIKGNFNPNYIEGVLIGIRTEPNHMETFEILGIHIIEWDDQR